MKQIETVVINGSVVTSGNLLLIVTANGMTNSPKTVQVPVQIGDSLSDVAYLCRYMLALDADISGFFLPGGSSTTVNLTARTDAANDTTMNLEVANGTSAGITPVPVSTKTQAGAAVITNGYCTLDDFKNYTRTESIGTLDDATIILFIEAASRYIDAKTNNTFYIETADHKFDCPTNELLLFDKHCVKINSTTNGDGSPVLSTQYVELGVNSSYRYGVMMISNSWRNSPITNMQCITVNADWGDPLGEDIRECCLLIVKAAYNRRFGENVTSTTMVTQAGAVITPEDVPAKARDIIDQHRRIYL